MKLRFSVNQAECFRRGIDCPKSIVSVEVDPAGLKEADRELIAKRLDGIDVLRIQIDNFWLENGQDPKIIVRLVSNDRIVANEPSFEELLAAVKRNEGEAQAALDTAKAKHPNAVLVDSDGKPSTLMPQAAK
jgi:hypothetical protein